MVASPNVGCFLRLSRFQGHLDLPIFKLQCERIAKKTSEKFHKIPNLDPSQYFSAYGGQIEIFIEFPATFAVIHSVESRES